MPFDANLKGPYKRATNLRELKRGQEAFGGSFIPNNGPRYNPSFSRGKTWGSLEQSHTSDILFQGRVLVVKGRNYYYSEETASEYLPALAFIKGRIYSGYVRSDCYGGLSFDGTVTENDGIELEDSEAFYEALHDAEEQARIACDIDTEYAQKEREEEEKRQREYDEKMLEKAREYIATQQGLEGVEIPEDAEVYYRIENGKTIAHVSGKLGISFPVLTEA